MLQVTIIPFIEEVGLEALKETFTEHHLEAATDFVEKLRSAKNMLMAQMYILVLKY